MKKKKKTRRLFDLKAFYRRFLNNIYFHFIFSFFCIFGYVLLIDI